MWNFSYIQKCMKIHRPDLIKKKKPQKYTNKDFNKNLLKGSKIKSENMVENDLKSS